MPNSILVCLILPAQRFWIPLLLLNLRSQNLKLNHGSVITSALWGKLVERLNGIGKRTNCKFHMKYLKTALQMFRKQWNPLSLSIFQNSSNCTHTPCTHTRTRGHPFMLRCPGSSWGTVPCSRAPRRGIDVERALYIHSPHRQSLPDRDSNSQPFNYESDSLPLGHDFHNLELYPVAVHFQKYSWWVSTCLLGCQPL